MSDPADGVRKAFVYPRNGVWEPTWQLTPASQNDVVDIVLKDKCPDECVVDFYALDTGAGKYLVSKESFEFILREEQYVEYPYVPGGKTSSGVTIGYGYDLGHQNQESVKKDLAGIYSDAERDRLLSIVGERGDLASRSLSQVANISISRNSALLLATRMKERYAKNVVDIYPEVTELHPHCQGALLSLVINRGRSLSYKESRRERREIQSDLSDGNPDKVPSRIRSMKRIWAGKGLGGLLSRRDREADLYERGMKCDCWE